MKEKIIFKGTYSNKKCACCGTDDKSLKYEFVKGKSKKKHRRFKGFLCDDCFGKTVMEIFGDEVGK